MKNRWYVNWLVVITVSLFLTSIGLFSLTLIDSLGLKKCAYGDVLYEDGRNCICDSKGRTICDDTSEERVRSEEFTTNNLTFRYEFLNFVETNSSFSQGVKFVDITHVGDTLRVRLEKNSLCSADMVVSPKVGFYKEEDGRMILTVGSNLVSGTFNLPCISEITYSISNLSVKLPSDYKIYYQDELDVLIPSGNCVFEGFLRNTGDAYNSSDGCSLCSCRLGQNICEQESKCLK
jgi:hypothetical protein